jgi:hypothetical protein
MCIGAISATCNRRVSFWSQIFHLGVFSAPFCERLHAGRGYSRLGHKTTRAEGIRICRWRPGESLKHLAFLRRSVRDQGMLSRINIVPGAHDSRAWLQR